MAGVPDAGERPPALVRRPDGVWAGSFEAMAGPCELLARTDEAAAREAVARVAGEARRIERKFSRYRPEGVVHQIHSAAGREVEVDEETSDLLDFAERCWELSGGIFDITSGVLRRAWSFAPGAKPPSQERLEALLPLIGWGRVSWHRPRIRLPEGMEIDLGGIGKEYAVDRAAARLQDLAGEFLVNFGGDLLHWSSVSPSAPNELGWWVGIESPDRENEAAESIHLRHGALATSGDARRSILHEGVRYGHVLDPRTGWPVAGAPRSVTVHAATCVEAGILATLALLQGPGAEAFLEAQGVSSWCFRNPESS